MDLATPVADISPLGKRLAKKLKRLNIETARDLLFYFPFRYDDFRRIIKIGEIFSAMPKNPASPMEIIGTVRGRVELIANKRSKYRRTNLTEAIVADDTGSIRVIWFNQPWLGKILKIGDRVALAGKIGLDRYGVQMISPVYEKDTGAAMHTGRLVPVYSLTQGLTEKQLRTVLTAARPGLAEVNEWLPDEVIAGNKLMALRRAVQLVHWPEDEGSLESAKRRLKFEELFLAQVQVAQARAEVRSSRAASIPFHEAETRALVAALPFQLTADQKVAAWKILKDMQSDVPMNRLLEGDVGSGKTVVAALAMYNCALHGFQSVIMAPTEILAEQHFQTICRLLCPHGVKVALVTGSTAKISWEVVPRDKKADQPVKKADRRGEKSDKISPAMVRQTASGGEAQIIIGTHALIQKGMRFHNLGLAVVDEQHRFGVDQRRGLKEKSGHPDFSPHFLSMTATPIPRSVALTLYGDLDLTQIRQMPLGRKKIITKIVDQMSRPAANEFVRQQVAAGRQVFVICPLIDPSDKLGVKSATAEAQRLKEDVFKNLHVALLHGRMKAKAKEKIMREFLNREHDILVSTSVIEVGVDVPNAGVMIIEGAERFGLAQLHQFRGRVGRSIHQSYCLLFTDSASPLTLARLEIFVKARDGFELAEKDLQLRGAGELFGTEQSGLPDFRIARLDDLELIESAKTAAGEIVDKDAALEQYPRLKEKLAEWGRQVHLE